jgi:hypothetical protein
MVPGSLLLTKALTGDEYRQEAKTVCLGSSNGKAEKVGVTHGCPDYINISPADVKRHARCVEFAGTSFGEIETAHIVN